jgi:hypothetical protein
MWAVLGVRSVMWRATRHAQQPVAEVLSQSSRGSRPIAVLLQLAPIRVGDGTRKQHDCVYECPDPERYQDQNADEAEQREEESYKAED